MKKIYRTKVIVVSSQITPAIESPADFHQLRGTWENRNSHRYIYFVIN